jgi:hypothetical protein
MVRYQAKSARQSGAKVFEIIEASRFGAAAARMKRNIEPVESLRSEG